jgi:hypothetical protein
MAPNEQSQYPAAGSGTSVSKTGQVLPRFWHQHNNNSDENIHKNS